MASWSDLQPFYTSGWTPDQAQQDFQNAFGGDINRLAQSRGMGTSGGGGGGGGKDPNYPQFSFDWEAAERDALEKLRPYYEAKLKEAKGDVELAKKRIEEDYTVGSRYREEDLTTQLADEKRLREQELRETTTDLNRRGVLFGQIPLGEETTRAPYSDVAQRFFLTPLSEKQQARKLAIERAITRQGEVAATTRKRDVEDIDIAYPRYERELGEEKKEKAILQMAPLKYQQEYGKYQTLLSRYMQGGA